MGCDIHVMVEVFEDNVWKNVDHYSYQRYCNVDNERMPEVVPIYEDRNYALFAFLADVRNYSHNPSFGFDRGFPDDADSITKKEYDSWGMDAHTPGYCTLAELKDKISTVKSIKRSGFVSKAEAERFRTTGEEPNSWAQGVGNSDNYEWLEWEDKVECFDALVSAIEKRRDEAFYVWINEDGSKYDSKIRIVFWFDN